MVLVHTLLHAMSFRSSSGGEKTVRARRGAYEAHQCARSHSNRCVAKRNMPSPGEQEVGADKASRGVDSLLHTQWSQGGGVKKGRRKNAVVPSHEESRNRVGCYK